MMRKRPKKEFGWCYTWKSLIIVSNLLSLFFAAMNLLVMLLYINNYAAQAKAWSAIAMCHLWFIPSMVTYTQNYNLLVQRNIIKKSKVKFIVGLIPLIMYEIVNILVLIFL